MSLQTNIKDQIKEAMINHDALKLEVIRGLVAQFTNELVSLKRKPTDELTDEEVTNVLLRAVKQRKDSIEQFTKGGREDLAQNEANELKILEQYLPKMMSPEEILVIAKQKSSELNITSKTEAGKFTGILMKELKGKALGETVKKVVDDILK